MTDDRPLLLDLFCCSGGAGMGYHRAGFRVIGVDIAPRPRYPFTFVQGDALAYVRMLIRTGLIHKYALAHGSPPCQAYCSITKGTHKGRDNGHPELYEPTRELLEQTGIPYVIENPAARADIVLCGEMFGLGVIRHRNMELGGWAAGQPKHIKHRGRVRGWRHGEYFEGPYIAAYGKGGGKGEVPEIQQAMGIDWTDERGELIEAIPPAYTEWIGRQFLAQV